MPLSRMQRYGVLAGFAIFLIFLLNSRRSSTSEMPLADIPHVKTDSSDLSVNADLQFLPGKPKDPSETYTKTIVMAKMKYQDIDWALKLEGFEFSIYHMDDPKLALTVPKNKGREAMAYLTYIIDNYENLPDVVLFFHPHFQTWHNNILLDMSSAKTITRMNPAHVVRQGYFPSRCHHDPGCPDWLHLDRPESDYDLVKKAEEVFFKADIWRQLHPNDPVPAAVSGPCCAQFAVSGERIRARPKVDYEHYRQWLLDTPIPDDFSGRILEYSWQFIFAGEAEFCPSQHKCYCDGYGICFGGTNDDNLLAWLKIQKQTEVFNHELEELEDQSTKNLTKIKEVKAARDAKSAIVEHLKQEAYRRGESPKNRAEECGRPWKEGDGF